MESNQWVEWHDIESINMTGEVTDWPEFKLAKHVETSLFFAGLKPALKLEDLGPVAVSVLRAVAAAKGVEVAVVGQDGAPTTEERDLAPSRVSRHTLFLARDNEALWDLLDAETAQRKGGAGRSQAIEQSGLALGYPECCAHFFAGLDRQDDSAVLDAYLHSAARHETSDPLLNIFPPLASPVTWYPCSFQCEATLDLARRSLSVLRGGDEPPSSLTDRLSGLVVAFERFLFVQFHGSTAEDGWFEYEAVSDALSCAREEPLLQSPALGDFRKTVGKVAASSNRVRATSDGLEFKSAKGVGVSARFLRRAMVLDVASSGKPGE